MLTNLGQLPLKTIHNNLKTFVTGSDHKYNKDAATAQRLFTTFVQARTTRMRTGWHAQALQEVMRRNVVDSIVELTWNNVLFQEIRSSHEDKYLRFHPH